MRLLLLFLILAFPFQLQSQPLGERKVLVILVNFSDLQTQPYTPTFVQGVLAETDGYIREASYDQAWMTTDVVGWYTIAESYSVCNPLTIASQAQAAATQGGANVSSYQHLVYMFPANACPWTASATVGGTPTQMWKKGQPNFHQTTHEFGHNLGLWHSRSLDCGPDVICENGTIDEYGDYFDVMGSHPTQSSSAAHFNLFQKERLGWLTPTVVTSHGDYVIDNLESISANKGLKIAKSSGQWYYIEKRSASGYDSFMSQYPNVINGVLIHVGHDGEGSDKTSYLLDASPPNDWFDPALKVGRSFVDTSIDLGVTLLSVNSTGAVVRITCAACVPPPDTIPPTVTITSPITTVPRNTTVNIQSTASDNVGVIRVEVYVNSVFICSDTSPPYSCSWNVPGKKNASYTITARAFDAYGNMGTNSVVVAAQ